MFDRTRASDRAVVVCLDLGEPDYVESIDEISQLAHSASVQVVAILKGRRQRPDAATFAGRGKVDELAELVRNQKVNVVIFNHDLSPAQQRNVELRIGCRVIDRTSLILDIFAQRARSHEGKLQVELAQLDHLATRLVRGWTHLERQKGGIGLRGPGETQLETDRRLLAKRVRVLRSKLAAFERQRLTRRRGRSRSNVISVSLVGYTNAGKSTLFNRLTHSDSYAADQLFATLDTTSRRSGMSGKRSVVLSDTVGFIRDLPHTLVEAFRATLEETVQADLLLHVVDAASSVREAHIAEVNKVLSDIGADKVPQVIVYNKIDLAGLSPGVERDACGRICALRVSAASGSGIAELRALYDEFQYASGSAFALEVA
ncbi:MAG: GTPase HflX [Burkholderiales bacterium]|nr:GTPase HflX [Burkholderiales bacterium]